MNEDEIRQLAKDKVDKDYGDGYCDLEAMINLFVDGYNAAAQQINLSLGDVSISLLKPLRNFIRSKHLSAEWEVFLKDYENNEC